MSVLATDDFNRANGGLGANWTTISGNGAPQVDTNQSRTNSVGTDSLAFYNGAVAPNDQYAKIKVNALTASAGVGAVTRAAPASNAYYCSYVFGNFGGTITLNTFVCVAGGHTTLASAAATVSTGSIVECRAQGSAITGLVDGVIVTGPTTDSSLASGQFGMMQFVDSGATTDALGDDWEGGDFGSGSPPAVVSTQPIVQPVPMRRGPLGLKRGRVFRFDNSNPVPLTGTVTGVSTLTLPLSPSATGTVLVQASSSASVALTGSATATNLAQAASAVQLAIAAAAAGTVDVQASSASQLAIAASAAATVGVQASSSITIAMTGSATLTLNPSPPPYQMAIPMRPTAGGFAGGKPFRFSADNPLVPAISSTATSSLTVPITGSASGTVLVQTSSALTVGLSGVAAATVLAQAASSITLPLSPTATGTNLVQAASAVQLAMVAAAAAAVTVQASSVCTIPISGSAQGGSGNFAVSSRTIAMTGSATGTVTDPSTEHPPVYGQSRFRPADYQSRFYPKDFQ